MIVRVLSGLVFRDIPRLSQRYPPLVRYGVFGVSTWPIGCDTPSPLSQLSVSPWSSWKTCEVEVRYPPPPQKVYLGDACAIPHENMAKRVQYPSAILSRKGIAQYRGVFRIGLLSSGVSVALQ